MCSTATKESTLLHFARAYFNNYYRLKLRVMRKQHVVYMLQHIRNVGSHLSPYLRCI